MYIPPAFRNKDHDSIFEFIRNNGFGILINTVDGLPFASHLPVELHTREGVHVLRCHVALGNKQWKSVENQDLLVIFHGPHSYISSSWYGHVNVPTWNYIAVHIYGRGRILSDEELYESLKELTDRYENNSEHPVRIESMKEYALQQMKGIKGIEISIDRIEGKWKMSQNRDDKDYKNVISELRRINDDGAQKVAEVMTRIKSDSGRDEK